MRIGHDVESYQNYFCVGIENYALGKKVLLEISEERNDLDKVYEFYSTYGDEIVSFNGIHYDNLIIQYIIKNYDDLKNSNRLTITNRIKDFSDLIINSQQDERVQLIRNSHKQWTDVDLFLYWSKMLRLSKKISLKSLGIQLGYPVVQELPFTPSSILEVDQLPTLREYNMTHDLGILKLLHDHMKEDVDLRAYIKETLGIPCMSMDAPKIASEILLYDYCKTKKLPIWKVRRWEFERKPIHLETVLRGFDPGFETKVFQDMFERWKNSYDTVSEEFIYSLNNTNVVLTYGIGGLHSVNENEMYTSNEDEIVMTSDVALA